MNKYLFLLITVTFLNSCNEYQKALKSEDIATKFKMGELLYDQGKFAKANRLFAQIVPNYRGKPQAEKLMFLYSNTFYKIKDYYTAGYQFERFTSGYPSSEKLEEASFFGAKSFYELTLNYTKDQSDTKVAIEKLQEFINLFPDSPYVSQANELIKTLDFKLEKKAFEIAKKYKDIAPGYTKDFNAAIKSFDNFLFEFPGSILREDAMFLKLEAMFQLALNSVEYKQTLEEGLVVLRKNRLEKAKEFSDIFKSIFTNSKYEEAVSIMTVTLTNELETYITKS